MSDVLLRDVLDRHRDQIRAVLTEAGVFGSVGRGEDWRRRHLGSTDSH